MKDKEDMKAMRDLRNSGGTRDMFLDDLKPVRIEAPRKSLNRNIGAYMSDGIAKRPMFGLHQLARLTEYLVYSTRHGREGNRKYQSEAEDLFFKVRTRQKSMITNHSKDWRLDESDLSSLRVFVLDMVAACRRLHEHLKTSHKVSCPCCGGHGTVYEESAVKIVQFAKKLLEEKKITRDDIPFALF